VRWNLINGGLCALPYLCAYNSTNNSRTNY